MATVTLGYMARGSFLALMRMTLVSALLCAECSSPFQTMGAPRAETSVSDKSPAIPPLPVPPTPPKAPEEPTLPNLPAAPTENARPKTAKDARRLKAQTVTKDSFIFQPADPASRPILNPTFRQNLERWVTDEKQFRIQAWKARNEGAGVEPLDTAEREQRREAIQTRLRTAMQHYEKKAEQGSLTEDENQQYRRLKEVARLFEKNRGSKKSQDASTASPAELKAGKNR